MQRTQPLVLPIAKLAICALLAVAANFSSLAADASGNWTWTTPGRDGGEGRKSTLKLKVEGEKVTGSISSPGRQGGEARETQIADGKIKGDELSFTVTREFNGNKMTAKYSGKVTADAITGKVETERDGNSRSRDWKATREKK